MDAMELKTARYTIRHDKDYETAQRLQTACGKKFDPEMLAQSQKNVAEMLDEPTGPVSIGEKLQQSIQQANKHRRTNRLDQVR